MKSLKEVLKEAIEERNLEEAGWLKKAAQGAALAGGIMASHPTERPPVKAPVSQGFDFTDEEQPDDRPHILAAIRAVESSGGKDLNHQLITKGPHTGEKAIGPYAFLPSTMKELIAKDSKLKAKYASILNLPFGNGEQSKIEKFCQKNPQIHDDLANHYVDQIMKRTPARSAADISQAWLYGITGFNRQVKNKKDMSSDRYAKASNAFNSAKGQQ